MIALAVIVLDELRDCEAEVALTERNDLVEALGLERKHKPLRDGVQIGASRTALAWISTEYNERHNLTCEIYRLA